MKKLNMKHSEQTIVRTNLLSFLTLTDQWKLTRREANLMIGLSGLHSIAHWSAKPDDVLLTEYQAERLSYILSICQLLDNHCQSYADVTQWLREPNPSFVFAHKPPLTILSGDSVSDLKRVASWLLSVDGI